MNSLFNNEDVSHGRDNLPSHCQGESLCANEETPN